MTTREEVPSLRSVIQRFEESSSALDSLNETILALGIAHEDQAEQVAAIRRMSDQASEFIARIGDASQLARDALTGIGAALEAATRFIEGTDLNALQSSMQATEVAVRTLAESQAPLLEHMNAEIGAVSNDQAKMQEAIDAYADTTRTAITGLAEDVRTAIGSLVQRAEAAEALTVEEKGRRQAAEAELESLRAAIAAVPEKSRRKFGL